MDQYEKLRKILHQAIDECCLRDAVNSTWLATPQEAEAHIMKALLPNVDELPENGHQETKAETLKELEGLASRFKMLVSYAERANTEVHLSDIQLDVARCKVKLETLNWVLKNISLEQVTGLLEIETAITKTKIQLETLEKVTCTSQTA